MDLPRAASTLVTMIALLVLVASCVSTIPQAPAPQDGSSAPVLASSTDY